MLPTPVMTPILVTPKTKLSSSLLNFWLAVRQQLYRKPLPHPLKSSKLDCSCRLLLFRKNWLKSLMRVLWIASKDCTRRRVGEPITKAISSTSSDTFPPRPAISPSKISTCINSISQTQAKNITLSGKLSKIMLWEAVWQELQPSVLSILLTTPVPDSLTISSCHNWEKKGSSMG